MGPALTHPVVVARLLQGGAEEEAAAGDARVLGALDVPVGLGGAGWLGALGSPHRGRPWDQAPGPARWVRVCVVDHDPFPLLQGCLTRGHTALPRPQGVLAQGASRSGVDGHMGGGTGTHWGWAQQGERTRGTDPTGSRDPTLFTWTYPADTRCSWRKVDFPAGGRGEGASVGATGGSELLGVRGQGVSPPGNPTATTTSGSELRRELDSGR